MQYLKKIETNVLFTMLTAHAAYYGRALTPAEDKDCHITIKDLQDEIASRKETASIVNKPGLR